MNFLVEHTWVIPLILTVIWLGICWWLINIMTGGMAVQFVLTLTVLGIGFIWMLFGAFHLIIHTINKWNY